MFIPMQFVVKNFCKSIEFDPRHAYLLILLDAYPRHHLRYQWSHVVQKALHVISPEMSQYKLVSYQNKSREYNYAVGKKQFAH